MTAAEPVRDAVLRVLFDALPTRAAYPTWDRNLLAYDIAGRVTASTLDALTAAGYRLAGPGEVVVRLPEPGRTGSSEGEAKLADGRGVRVTAVGDIFDHWSRRHSPARAREHAAALLAAADWADRLIAAREDEAAAEVAPCDPGDTERPVSQLTGLPCGHSPDRVCVECGTDQQVAAGMPPMGGA